MAGGDVDENFPKGQRGFMHAIGSWELVSVTISPVQNLSLLSGQEKFCEVTGVLTSKVRVLKTRPNPLLVGERVCSL